MHTLAVIFAAFGVILLWVNGAVDMQPQYGRRLLSFGCGCIGAAIFCFLLDAAPVVVG